MTTVSSVHLSLHVVWFLSLGGELLRSTLSSFQIYNTVLLTLVTMLYVTSPDLIYLITVSLHPYSTISNDRHDWFMSLPSDGDDGN